MERTLTVLDDDNIFHKIMDYAHANSGSYRHIYHNYEAKQLLTYLYEHRDRTDELPDVIFVDIYLPVIDGWAFLDAFGQLHLLLCKRIVVYIMTTSIRQQDKLRAGTYPFVEEYLTKPVATAKLKEIALKINSAA